MPTMRPAVVPQADIPLIHERVAGVYDVWGLLTESKARRLCVERAAVRDGEALLEVAVGTGLTFVELVRRNPHGRNVGVDLTPAMVERARRRFSRKGPASPSWRLATPTTSSSPTAASIAACWEAAGM